jgi:hypothetical protein
LPGRPLVVSSSMVMSVMAGASLSAPDLIMMLAD